MQLFATHSAVLGRLRAYAFCLTCMLCTLLLSGTGRVAGSSSAQGANTAGQSPLQRSKELVPTQGALAGKTVYTNSFALVVGCGTYPNLPADKQLDFARKDALAMRALLIRSYGFLPDNVILLLDADATKTNIEQALNRFTDRRTVRSTDRLFVYFSGHGQTVTSTDGQTDGFLIPTDAKVDLDKPGNLSDYVQTCVSMQKVRAFLEDSPAQHCLVMADACFSGFLVRGKGGGKLADKVLLHLAAEPAYQVLAAGGRGESAWEDPRLGNSVFTYACLQSLRDNAKEEGNVLLTSELGIGVKRVVLSLTGGKQTPQAGNVRASEGEFLFVATLPQSVLEAKSGLSVSSSGVFGRRVQAVEVTESARSEHTKRDYVEAERLYKKALELDPDYSYAYNGLGAFYFEVKHDYVEAERLFKKAIELNPNFSNAYYNLGSLYRSVKYDNMEAERLYRKAIELDPKSAYASNGLGLVFYAKRDYVEAERLYKKAIELDPSNSNAYNSLGFLYFNNKRDYVEAERLYRKAITVDPTDSRAYSNLGDLNYDIKHDYVEAERLYRKAIELDPNYGDAYYNLGNLCCNQKKDYVEAERLYKKVIEVNPDDSDAHANLARALLYQGKRDAAIVAARHAQELGLTVHPVYKELGL